MCSFLGFCYSIDFQVDDYDNFQANVEHMDRFSKEFGTGDVEDDEEQKHGSSKSQNPTKPADHQILFGGNNNDHFMLGIKFTKLLFSLHSMCYYGHY